jgi:phage-related protein
VKEYFKQNGTNFTAAQAGAAIYGAASAAAVLMAFGPSAAIPFVGPAAVKLGSNVGEFYGSIVDDMAALIKGETDSNVADFVGTMGTLFFTKINPVVQGLDLIRFMNSDGWSLTKEIGEVIGSGLEAAVEGVGTVVGEVVHAIGGAIGDVVVFVGGIFS